MNLNWIYQLQGIDPVKLGACHAAVKVVDAFNDDAKRWTVAEVNTMRGSPNAKLLAYLSIGEAEDYREYWNKGWNEGERPEWMGEENPDWPGNFKVNYWHPDWQNIILTQVDRIVSQGFDGVYLDIIDAYEYYEERSTQRPYATYMVGFVSRIAAHARLRRPNFWIVPQNGEGLLEHPHYVTTIDAIGKEDIFYGFDDTKLPNLKIYSDSVGDDLAVMKSAAKPVLLVEYDLSERQKDDVRRKSANDGYSLYFTTRDLDELSEPESPAIA